MTMLNDTAVSAQLIFKMGMLSILLGDDDDDDDWCFAATFVHKVG